MFTCSNCGHPIDDARVPVPPFCPRCGQSTTESSPFDDDDDLLPPPGMDDSLPPLPSMGDLPPMSGRGEPSKTLFGMPGLPLPGDDLAFPTDDEDSLIAPPVRRAPAGPVPPKPAPTPPVARAPMPQAPVLGKPPQPPAMGKPPQPPALGKPPQPPVLGKPPQPPAIAKPQVGSSLASANNPLLDDDEPTSSSGQSKSMGYGGAQEFEFVSEDAGLELGDFDPPLGGQPPPSTAGQEFDSFNMQDDDEFDLPAPAGHSSSSGLNLPTPSKYANDVDLPEPPRRAADFDLPAPVGRPSSSGSNLPAARKPVSIDDDLSFDDLPMPVGDDDFPAPIDDFPAPQVDDDFDGFLPAAAENLPRPADLLPTPAANLPTPSVNLPTAAGNLPRPADLLPTPVETLGLDLDLDHRDANLPQARATRGPAPATATAGQPAAASATTGAAEATAGKPTPAGLGKPSAKPKRDLARYAVYGVLGLVLVGFGGAYVAMEMGMFDPEPPPPVEPSANKPVEPPPTPTTQASERSEAMLAKLDLDTPAGYAQVLALAEGSNDTIARAEAALLLHLRYGPDPTQLALANQLLTSYSEAGLLEPTLIAKQPFVRRVVGLATLAAGRPDEALAMFDAEEPRSQVYRAWVLLDQGKHDDARKAAEAAVASRPNHRAGQLAVLEARLAANPIDGLAAMRQAAATASDHLALQEALLAAAFAQGRLGEASAIGQKLDLGAIGPAHKAEQLRLRAKVAMAQGRTGDAMRLLDQALATEEGSLPARIDRVELWLVNKDFAALRTEVDLLTRAHPSDPAVIKLAARVDLQAGRDEDARAWLAQLGEASATDPEFHDIQGQAHMFTGKPVEAQASFAEARKLDPLYWPAILHEAELLVRDLQVPQALSFLDAQQTALIEADAKSSERGRIALAAVARQRALINRDRGQLEAAVSATDDAIAILPADNEALLLRAVLLGQLGQREAHEAALTELFERTGGFPGLTEPYGKVLLRNNQLEQLEALIGTALDSEDASREVLLTGAALRIWQDKPDQGKLLAQKVLDRDPTDARAHLLLGRALLAQGEYAGALDEIESAQTREGDPEVEVWLGQALEYNGRAAEAPAHYLRAIELDPSNLEAAALLGRLYAYEGAAKQAVELLEPVVEQTNEYPYAWLAIGLAQRDLNQREAAIASFRKAQEFDPTLFEAYYQEGRIHNDQNKHGAAVKALQAGVDKGIANAQEIQLIDAWRRLGESYFELGRRTEAKTAFEEYLEIAPADSAGRREVERMLRDL